MGNVGLACESCQEAVQDTFNPNEFKQEKNSVYPLQTYARPIQQYEFQFNQKVNEVLKNKDMPLPQNVQYYEQSHNIQQPFLIVPLNIKYKGRWFKGKPHGQGQIKFADGSCLKGWFKNGLCDEQNKHLFIFSDGAYYLGTIKSNNFEGKGTYQSPEYIYEGEWKGNKPHGKGKQLFKDSSKYAGQFIEGQKHGQGVFQWLNQNSIFLQYIGSFQNGYIQGYGTLKKKNNQIISGDFKTIPQQGKIITKNATVKKEGSFQAYQIYLQNLIMNGNGNVKFNNNNTFSGTIKNGQIDGKGKGTISYKTQNIEVDATWIKGYPTLNFHQIKQQDIQSIALTINNHFKNSKTIDEALKELRSSKFAKENNYDFYIHTKQNVKKYLQSKRPLAYVSFPISKYEILVQKLPKDFGQQ